MHVGKTGSSDVVSLLFAVSDLTEHVQLVVDSVGHSEQIVLDGSEIGSDGRKKGSEGGSLGVGNSDLLDLDISGGEALLSSESSDNSLVGGGQVESSGHVETAILSRGVHQLHMADDGHGAGQVVDDSSHGGGGSAVDIREGSGGGQGDVGVEVGLISHKFLNSEIKVGVDGLGLELELEGVSVNLDVDLGVEGELAEEWEATEIGGGVLGLLLKLTVVNLILPPLIFSLMSSLRRPLACQSFLKKASTLSPVRLSIFTPVDLGILEAISLIIINYCIRDS